MVDFVALVTPPILVGPNGEPAQGKIYAHTTNTFALPGVLVVPYSAQGLIKDGAFTKLDGSPYLLPVTPEGGAIELVAEIFQDVPGGQRTKHYIRRTVATPNASTVTWDTLTDVVPVAEGGDYVLPSWAASLDAKATEAIAAAEQVALDRVATETAAAEAAAFGGTNNTQVAGMVTVDGPTKTALTATIANEVGGAVAGKADASVVAKARRIDTGGVYRPTEYADLVWRKRRAATLAGIRQGHIAVLGDSRSFGAAATGTSNPKYASNYPGRLRAALNKKYGSAGTGQVIMDYNIRTTPAYDDRFVWGGTISGPGFGYHAASSALLNAAGAGVLDFTATCEEFWIYNLQSNGGLNTVSVDGGAPQTFRNLASTGAAPALPSEPGYHSTHIVTRVPAGPVGPHTMRVATNGMNNAVLVAVEGRIPTPGTFRVSNPSISGKSLSTMLTNSVAAETSGLIALPMIDMLRADMLLIALGINDWQGASPIATVKTRLMSLIQRQRGIGAAPVSGTMPGGDAALVWLPQPNLAVLQPVGGPTWEEYRQAYYEVADEQNCVLFDFGDRWKDYSTANALGLFGDTIHENNEGSLDVAAGLLSPLGL